MVRRSTLDLDDGAIAGGRLDDWTYGVNWRRDAHTRLMVNIIDAEVTDVGDAQLFTFRVQHEF